MNDTPLSSAAIGAMARDYSTEQAKAVHQAVALTLNLAQSLYQAYPLDDAADLEILISNLEECELDALDILEKIKAIDPASIDVRPDRPD